MEGRGSLDSQRLWANHRRRADVQTPSGPWRIHLRAERCDLRLFRHEPGSPSAEPVESGSLAPKSNAPGEGRVRGGDLGPPGVWLARWHPFGQKSKSADWPIGLKTFFCGCIGMSTPNRTALQEANAGRAPCPTSRL